MDRVFSNLKLKTIDEDQRIVEGWATTNAIDRAGDIVEPDGVEFDLVARPIPFLFDHDHSQAVGEIEAAEVTSRGIKFRARIYKIAHPGLAKDFLDRAWDLLRAGTRKAVSIGFRALDWVNLPGGGARFTRWEWLELSACAVPMNPEAQITGLKRAPSSVRQITVGKPALRVVKLTEKEKLIGKWKTEAALKRAARERVGIPRPVVKLGPVDLHLAHDRIRRDQRTARPRQSGKVRVVRL
ncbi:HK97 family phage prohead protease [Sphingopyxis witflariensis]|uniref:Peptidase U35 n=1 Tax=Sphingopyxis witflariensis TaxID=173675 RepID=A0A2D0AMX7_9SPHN|nr:HK97 family phage prohead protease [Sphingopyxis witflariensis]OWQ95110.1 peptidase U35 [Sphingopyxis witflariensis]